MSFLQPNLKRKTVPDPFPLDIDTLKRGSFDPFSHDALSKPSTFRGRKSLDAVPTGHGFLRSRNTGGCVRRGRLTRSPSPRNVEESFAGQLNTPVYSYLCETQADDIDQQHASGLSPLRSPGSIHAKQEGTMSDAGLELTPTTLRIPKLDSPGSSQLSTPPHRRPHAVANGKGRAPPSPAPDSAATTLVSDLLLTPNFAQVMKSVPDPKGTLFENLSPQHVLVLFQLEELETEIQHLKRIISTQEVTVKSHQDLLGAQKATLEAHTSKYVRLTELLDANIARFMPASPSTTSQF